MLQRLAEVELEIVSGEVFLRGDALALLLGIGRFVLGFGDSNVVYYEYSSTTSTTVNGVGDDGRPRVETRRSSSMRTNVPGLAERSVGSEDGGDGGGGGGNGGVVEGPGLSEEEAARLRTLLSRDFFF